jgi:hypothetical protein
MALDPLTAGMNLASSIVDKVWPDAGEADRAKLVAAVELTKAQLAVNQAEAGHRSMFVAGWRPFIGWTCGVAFAYHFVGHEWLTWASLIWFPQITPPASDIDDRLFELLMGMLGIGVLRTVEKIKGVTR